MQGWEVKSLRAGKANIGDSYVILKDGEAFLFGANFTPLTVASSHYVCDPTRTRKLLLNKRELESSTDASTAKASPWWRSLCTGKTHGAK